MPFSTLVLVFVSLSLLCPINVVVILFLDYFLIGLAHLRQPTKGKVYWNGQELTGMKHNERIRYEHFGFVFQQHFLIPYLTVMENVCIANNDRNLKESAREILEQLGIASLTQKQPFELSGGERQRVAIARALVKHPDVIFADEPTASLDKENAIKIFSLLKDASKKCIVIMATHDTSLLNGDERVLVLENARIS